MQSLRARQAQLSINQLHRQLRTLSSLTPIPLLHNGTSTRSRLPSNSTATLPHRRHVQQHQTRHHSTHTSAPAPAVPSMSAQEQQVLAVLQTIRLNDEAAEDIVYAGHVTRVTVGRDRTINITLRLDSHYRELKQRIVDELSSNLQLGKWSRRVVVKMAQPQETEDEMPSGAAATAAATAPHKSNASAAKSNRPATNGLAAVKNIIAVTSCKGGSGKCIAPDTKVLVKSSIDDATWRIESASAVKESDYLCDDDGQPVAIASISHGTSSTMYRVRIALDLDSSDERNAAMAESERLHRNELKLAQYKRNKAQQYAIEHNLSLPVDESQFVDDAISRNDAMHRLESSSQMRQQMRLSAPIGELGYFDLYVTPEHELFHLWHVPNVSLMSHCAVRAYTPEFKPMQFTPQQQDELQEFHLHRNTREMTEQYLESLGYWNYKTRRGGQILRFQAGVKMRATQLAQMLARQQAFTKYWLPRAKRLRMSQDWTRLKSWNSRHWRYWSCTPVHYDEPQPWIGFELHSQAHTFTLGNGIVTGNSTVATNLAFSLSQQSLIDAHTGASRRARVGLLDADLYGSSLPSLIQPKDTRLLQSPESALMIRPVMYEDVATMSYGYVTGRASSQDANATESQSILSPSGSAAAFMRGPLASKTMQQLLQQTAWSQLDYLVIDCPPGTGDIHLTLQQSCRINAALCVTLPSALSQIDVVRGLRLLQAMRVPVLALVENMSYFECDSCDKKHRIFQSQRDPTDTNEPVTSADIQRHFDIPHLFELPIVSAMQSTRPLVLQQDSTLSQQARNAKQAYLRLARTIQDHLQQEEVKALQQSTPNASASSSNVKYDASKREIVLQLDGAELRVQSRALRLACRCAACVDEVTDEPRLDPAKVPLDVHPIGMQQRGNYAVAIHWSDAHASGIHTFEQIKLLAKATDAAAP